MASTGSTATSTGSKPAWTALEPQLLPAVMSRSTFRSSQSHTAFGARLHDRISVHFHVMKANVLTPGKALEKLPAGSFVHVDRLPGGRGAASSAVSRAHKRGDLVPVRKGLYFKGAKTRYGMTRPSAEAVATEILGRVGVGPTGYSAARVLGVTTQVPARPSLTFAGPVATSIPAVRVSKRNNMRRRELNYKEIAVLELLRGDWESTVEGGWPALVTTVRRAVRAKEVRLGALADAVDGERSPAARANFARLNADIREKRFSNPSTAA